METIEYVLRITCDRAKIPQVSAILGIVGNASDDYDWVLKLGETDPGDEYWRTFINLLEGKYDQLEALGVKRDDITIWLYYGYENQCNFEFHPDQMLALGKNGIVLCVSCWEAV